MSKITSENIFEIIGVYFANTYWNTLYQLALDDWRDEKFDKKEEAYKTMIERYSRAFCSPNEQNERINKHYVRIIKDLYINFKEYLNSGDTLLGFIDIISKFLLPIEYYKTLSSRDTTKDIIIRKILTKTLMKFTIYILQEEVKKVIDEKLRNEKKYVIEWKNKFIDILTQERNEFCTLLLAQNSGIDIRNKDEIPQIPKEVCDKLQLKIKNLILEKSDLIHKLNKYTEYISLLKKIIKENEMNKENKNENENFQPNLNKLKNKIITSKSTRASRLSQINKKPINKEIQQESKEEPKEEHKEIQQEHKEKQQEIKENQALKQLENEEYSGDEFQENIRAVNVEEIDLPANEFQTDE